MSTAQALYWAHRLRSWAMDRRLAEMLFLKYLSGTPKTTRNGLWKKCRQSAFLSTTPDAVTDAWPPKGPA